MTARTQTAPVAPQGDDATATPSPPSGTPKARRKARPAPGKGARGLARRSGTKRHAAAGRKIGPDAREEAYRLIVEGLPLAAIARKLRVKAHTIAAWRDSEEGISRLKALREARNMELGATLKSVRLQIEAALPRAAQVMADLLDHPDPKVRLRAAAQLCDRGGVIRTERLLDGQDPDALDLSELTAEELDQLRALHEKASRRGPLA